MGYSYQVQFRITGENGFAATYDFTQFTTTQGPIKTVVSYERDKTSTPNPDKKTIERRFGWRPRCSMAFEFPISALDDEAQLAEIVTYLNRNNNQGYLSLDGGTTEREIVMDSAYLREPLADKHNAGVYVEVSFRGVDLIEEVPDIGAGTW